MSKWITDREPTEDDAPMNYIIVWGERNVPIIIAYVNWHKRYPWMPIPNPEPYVAPKRWQVSSAEFGDYVIYDAKFGVYMEATLPTREAAERIAAIYNEVMP